MHGRNSAHTPFRHSIHTPLNRRTFVGAHNAYDQPLTITDLLDEGVRVLELDQHYNNKAGVFEVYHKGDLFSAPPKPIFSFFDEILKWLRKNKREIAFVTLEDSMPNANHGQYRDSFAKPLKDKFGHIIYDHLDRLGDIGKSGSFWPSEREMLDRGKRLFICAQWNSHLSNLIHDCNWGGNYRNPFNTSTIRSFKPDCSDFRGIQDKFIEVGEARGIIPTFHIALDYLQSFLPKSMIIVPEATGYIEVSDIRALKQCDVNIISLDNIKRNDPRVKAILYDNHSALTNTTQTEPSPFVSGALKCAFSKVLAPVVNTVLDTVGRTKNGKNGTQAQVELTNVAVTGAVLAAGLSDLALPAISTVTAAASAAPLTFAATSAGAAVLGLSVAAPLLHYGGIISDKTYNRMNVVNTCVSGVGSLAGNKLSEALEYMCGHQVVNLGHRAVNFVSRYIDDKIAEAASGISLGI